MGDFESLTAEFKLMETRLNDMEGKIDSINTKLTQVVEAILGNPLTKSGGFIGEIKLLNDRIEDLKKEIEDLRKKQVEHDKFKDRVIWSGIILAAAAGVFKFFTYIYAVITTTNTPG
jgi:predicted  nucleic acid-binding Zn-ribbon protein